MWFECHDQIFSNWLARSYKYFKLLLRNTVIPFAKNQGFARMTAYCCRQSIDTFIFWVQISNFGSTQPTTTEFCKKKDWQNLQDEEARRIDNPLLIGEKPIPTNWKMRSFNHELVKELQCEEYWVWLFIGLVFCGDQWSFTLVKFPLFFRQFVNYTILLWILGSKEIQMQN